MIQIANPKVEDPKVENEYRSDKKPRLYTTSMRLWVSGANRMRDSFRISILESRILCDSSYERRIC